MKPTIVRSMLGDSPQRSTISRSMPGAEKPVHEVTMTCLTPHAESRHGLLRQHGRILLVLLQALRRARKLAARIERRAFAFFHGQIGAAEKRKPFLDARTLRHAAEESELFALIGKDGAEEVLE
jgi:hypothetical protein